MLRASFLTRSLAPHGGAVFSFGAAAYCSNDKPILAAPYNYIDGAFAASSRAPMTVLNPCTNASIGLCPNSGSEETEAAIVAASRAFGPWSATTARTRAVALRRLADLMMANQQDLAAILARESGKPLAEAAGEVAYSARYVEWYAGEAERTYGDIVPDPRGGVRTTVVKRPVGVVGIITPWNFPSAMVTRAAAGALAAGCTAVVKPSELTPFSALALCQLAEAAGIPRGALNVVVGDAKAIGSALVDSFDVRKLSFTGSTRVGKALMRGCADTVKRTAMELGGNAPLIVCEDADISRAVEGAMAAKFRNAGQTCICANRIFVHSSVHDAFVAGVVAACERMVVGDGLLDGRVTMGPVITQRALRNIEAAVATAVAAGAVVETGGARVEGLAGNFYKPTVLTNCTNSMELSCNEIFGPVMPIIRYDDGDDVVAMANHTRAGLAAYVYTQDYRKQWDMSARLAFGMVGINDTAISSPAAPFGGVKESGVGRDGGRYGIDAFLDVKYVLHSTV